MLLTWARHVHVIAKNSAAFGNYSSCQNLPQCSARFNNFNDMSQSMCESQAQQVICKPLLSMLQTNVALVILAPKVQQKPDPYFEVTLF